jgi:dimethylaniline monooxygenase (N-oxide forming)
MIHNTIIIGAGISGLFVLKHLKENNNHDVLVIDKNPEPFGVWNIKNHPSVKEFTYCVSSKLYMTISDFPIPEEYPEFPHHNDILEYYKSYAKRFDLFKHIYCNITVIKIKKKHNIWYIKTKDIVYRSKNLVLACGTVNNCLNMPKDDIYNNFTGIKFHSDNYDEHKHELINKKILLIGVSDMSCDIAEELKKTNTVTMSENKGKGVWFQNRHFGAYGPADMLYSRTIDFFIKNIIGKTIFQYIFFGRSPLTVPLWWGENGHGIKDWNTDSGYLNSYYVKSRDIISSISKGQIKAVGGIKEINKKKITFNNNYTCAFDIIIFCTGYKPFGSLKFINKKYYQNIYKHIFSYEDTSLCFAGYVRPYLTSIPMLSELQSRWISKEICNNNTLPNKKQMLTEIKKDNIKQTNEFPSTVDRLHTIVDPYDYCNMIADKISAKPNIYNYFMTNINLFIIIVFYSWNHHYFRLNDSNNEKVKIAYDNIFHTSKNDTSIQISNFCLWYPLNCIIIILMFLFLYYLFWRKF